MRPPAREPLETDMGTNQPNICSTYSGSLGRHSVYQRHKSSHCHRHDNGFLEAAGG